MPSLVYTFRRCHSTVRELRKMTADLVSETATARAFRIVALGTDNR
jgi:hypothetical protein